MAAIDKTYLSDWNEFNTIRNWAIKQQFVLKNGQIIKLKNYLYYPNLTREEWNEMHDNAIKYAEAHYNTPEYTAHCKKLYGNDWEFDAEDYFDVVLWNTPTYVDIWLIRNCPFEFIQDRLKEQYGGGWSKTTFTNHNEDNLYEQIKNGTSVYDTFQRNGLGKNAKITIQNKYGHWFRDSKSFWSICINLWENNGKSYWYNEYDNMWYSNEEAMPWSSNYYHYKGNLTKKNILNLIRKWNLPKGTIISFSQDWKRYNVHEFNVIVK